jgi:predicted ArsR family transcriptional regulator
VADEILAALRNSPDGMTRTQIRDLFKRHKSPERLDIALESLMEAHLAKSERRQTGGRPVEIWRCAESDQSDQSGAGAS